MTGKGIVILARVDSQWVLAVLFEADFQLGGALSRTKAVVDLLKQVDLPPPPAGLAEVEEVIPQVEGVPIAETESAMTEETVMQETIAPEPMETIPAEAPEAPAERRHVGRPRLGGDTFAGFGRQGAEPCRPARQGGG